MDVYKEILRDAWGEEHIVHLTEEQPYSRVTAAMFSVQRDLAFVSMWNCGERMKPLTFLQTRPILSYGTAQIGYRWNSSVVIHCCSVNENALISRNTWITSYFSVFIIIICEVGKGCIRNFQPVAFFSLIIFCHE